ncbi:hypothetical protein GYA49_02585 [Candidatus Beckwithbacteria bacterium]|nr:hypothetical protein [Candidatus Beckwithbacteria bacterium]
MVNKQRGQTIIELLIAITVITMVFITLALMSTKSVQMSDLAQNRQSATYLAKKEIELVRKMKNTQTWEQFTTSIGNNNYASTENKIDFTIDRAVNVDPSDNEKYEVVVTVMWDDVKGSHEVKETTFITKW